MVLKAYEPFIYISTRSQLLKLYKNNTSITYHISTSKNGLGEELNSFKTPRGWHYIRAIIGKENPINTFYKARRIAHTPTDISGRILWLCGLNVKNHSPATHSMLRYIYIHGVSNKFLTSPISNGCINMRNQDIMNLTNIIPKYCKVYIDGSE